MSSESVLIVGGGPAGLEAARLLADIGTQVVLVEKRDFLGGTPIAERYAALTHGFRDAETVMKEMTDAVTGNPLVDLRLNSVVTDAAGEAGNFKVTVAKAGNGLSEEVEAGAVIIATGFQHFDPGRETQVYSYYEYPDVITLADAESMLKDGHFRKPSNGETPERVCFIQCVGSRDRQIGNEFCSKVCCGISSKQAIEVRQVSPSTKVFIFYIDMRMYGYWENEIYWPAQEEYRVQYIKGIITEIVKKGERLLIRGEDTTMGRPMEVPMDIVVLAVGMEASQGTRQMAQTFGVAQNKAQTFGVAQNKYKFVDVPHDKLDPVATSVPGVFVAGAAAGPKDLDDSIGMAGTAAIKAAGLIRKLALATA
jgi:heterodisulfide reductase subunit A